MSTKTTKRKRATRATETAETSAGPASAPAPEIAPVATVAAEPVAPDELAVSAPAMAAAAPVAAAPAAPTATPTIALFSNCTVKDAAGLKQELLQWLDEPSSVAIDAKSVERIDTAIMQLLCAFVRDRAERNLGVTWSGATRPLFDAARLLGVGAMLALPTEAAP